MCPSAQTPQPSPDDKFVAALIEYGEELVAYSQRLLREYRNHSKHHLLDALEYEANEVEAFVIDLRAKHAKHLIGNTHHLDAVQDQLLQHEHRLKEEIEIVQHIFDHPIDGNTDVHKLLTAAQKLVKDAQHIVDTEEVVKTHPQEKAAIEREIKTLNNLIKAIELKPTGEKLNKEEETLLRHEKTLKALLTRLHHN